MKPLVIRINDVGRAEAVDYDAATYRPQAPELRYFLTRFVVTHFSRLRATVQRDIPTPCSSWRPRWRTPRSRRMIARARSSCSSPTPARMTSTSVSRTSRLTQLTAAPYRAAIDFDKSYYSQGTRQERKHETFVAQVEFTLRDAVPNAFIRVNPLGLQITNFGSIRRSISDAVARSGDLETVPVVIHPEDAPAASSLLPKFKETPMPLIPPRTTRTKVVRHITQLYQENNEELFAYAKFIGEPTAYVLNALIERLQKDDKDYREWRAENAASPSCRRLVRRNARTRSRITPHERRRAGMVTLPQGA